MPKLGWLRLQSSHLVEMMSIAPGWFRAQRTHQRRRAPGLVPRVRSHCRFRSRGTEYVSESGMKWISGGTKRQCDRALIVPKLGCVSRQSSQRAELMSWAAGWFRRAQPAHLLGRAGYLIAPCSPPHKNKTEQDHTTEENCLLRCVWSFRGHL
jgi:hypothetical protein